MRWGEWSRVPGGGYENVVVVVGGGEGVGNGMVEGRYRQATTGRVQLAGRT